MRKNSVPSGCVGYLLAAVIQLWAFIHTLALLWRESWIFVTAILVCCIFEQAASAKEAKEWNHLNPPSHSFSVKTLCIFQKISSHGPLRIWNTLYVGRRRQIYGVGQVLYGHFALNHSVRQPTSQALRPVSQRDDRILAEDREMPKPK